MNQKIGTPTPTDKLIHKLRLMADAGGMLTRDRIRVAIEAADRLEELDERVAIMSEYNQFQGQMSMNDYEPITDPFGGDT